MRLARRFLRLANTRLQICRERVEELARRLGFEQSRSYRVIFYQSHERADANQIIVHEPLRNADEKPVGPDPYVVSIGLTKVRGNTAYAPIRALLDARP